MKRIAGILNLDNTPVKSFEIDRMIAVMKYQPQDGDTSWIDGEIGMGYAQVGTVASKGHDCSILCSPGEQYGIVYDGRIDNRRELLAALKSQLTQADPMVCDEEIVLAAYQKWGLECPRHLVGDFSFAVWDSEQQRLICVRDRFCVKPFFYSLSRSSFVFGSTPLALFASQKVLSGLYEERMADFLMEFGGAGLEGVDKESSFYKDVFRLPPAHMIIVNHGGMTIQRYWEVHPVINTGVKADTSYIEEFREIFEEAVRCRLQDIVVPASMLSGGMDSSAIVGMSRKVLSEAGRNPLHVFAGIPKPVSSNREIAHIASVLDQGNLQAHLISEADILQCMDTLVEQIDTEAEPFDCLMNLNRSIFLYARDQGISAVFDGIDGDVLLTGSGHLLELWMGGAFRTLLDETFKADGLTAEYKMGRKLFLNSLVSILTPFLPDRLRNTWRQWRYGTTARAAVGASVIDYGFAIRSHLDERMSQLDSYSLRPTSNVQTEFHKIALEHPFLIAALERYGRVASSLGIEARHPLLDVRLVEFCLGLPWQWKTRRGWTKYILRRAMEPYLPPEVVWRRDKDSLMWEVNRMVLKQRADVFYQVTCDEQENLKPYVDMGKLKKFWQEYLTRGNEEHAMQIWSGIALAFWLRRHRNLSASLARQQ